MTCATLAATAGAVVIPLVNSNLPENHDVLVIGPSDKAVAEVCYHNHADRVSFGGTWDVNFNGVTVSAEVKVQSTDKEGAKNTEENITLSPSVGYIVYPADDARADVSDGQTHTALIYGGLS